MTVVFLFPLAFSLFAAVMFVIGDYSAVAKAVFSILALTAVAMQFTPYLQERVHFLVPLAIQLFVCGSWYVASRFE
jgi:hypothetical protein